MLPFSSCFRAAIPPGRYAVRGSPVSSSSARCRCGFADVTEPSQLLVQFFYPMIWSRRSAAAIAHDAVAIVAEARATLARSAPLAPCHGRGSSRRSSSPFSRDGRHRPSICAVVLTLLAGAGRRACQWMFPRASSRLPRGRCVLDRISLCSRCSRGISGPPTTLVARSSCPRSSSRSARSRGRGTGAHLRAGPDPSRPGRRRRLRGDAGLASSGTSMRAGCGGRRLFAMSMRQRPGHAGGALCILARATSSATCSG